DLVAFFDDVDARPIRAAVEYPLRTIEDAKLLAQLCDPEGRPAGSAADTEWTDVKAVEKAAERLIQKSTYLAMKRGEGIGRLIAPHGGFVAAHGHLTSLLRNELSHAYLLSSRMV